ncbi:MAG: FKBP-type peptidyl-prolyl cis-trans isomerase [Bacteroidales bacterium]|nr:FKBP-type peptidyl-prolyl cis-trans isomerase [Bacteroidales bacterium]
MMRKGGKATVIVPSKLAFGEKGKSLTIPPYSPLIYNIDLLDIKTAAEIKAVQLDQAERLNERNDRNAKEGMAYLIKMAGKDGVISTKSGLLYEIVKQGTGSIPTKSDKVQVHYSGSLIDGRKFDGTKDHAATFKVDGVISGWTEVLQLMPVGSKYKVYIPSGLAYHGNPPEGTIIEPFMPLVFEIELITIVK